MLRARTRRSIGSGEVNELELIMENTLLTLPEPPRATASMLSVRAKAAARASVPERADHRGSFRRDDRAVVSVADLLAAGAPELLLLVSICDVVLGPTLTFVVYRPGKRGMKFDLAVIALLQLGALGYGVHTVHVARPVFNVFAIDRFELVSEADIEPEQLARAPAMYRDLSQSGPRLVAAELPADADERSTLLMAAATQGIDLKHLPVHYRPYDEVRVKALAKAMPLRKLTDYNAADQVNSAIAATGRAPSRCATSH